MLRKQVVKKSTYPDLNNVTINYLLIIVINSKFIFNIFWQKITQKMNIYQKFRFRSCKQYSNLGLTFLGGNILVTRELFISFLTIWRCNEMDRKLGNLCQKISIIWRYSFLIYEPLGQPRITILLSHMPQKVLQNLPE